MICICFVGSHNWRQLASPLSPKVYAIGRHPAIQGGKWAQRFADDSLASNLVSIWQTSRCDITCFFTANSATLRAMLLGSVCTSQCVTQAF